MAVTRRTRRDQRGSITVEMVLVTPALLIMLMTAVQFGLYMHARSVAEQAAVDGATTARRFDGTAAEGKARTDQLLDDAADRLLPERTVHVDRSATQVTVRIDATVVSLLPGLHLEVHEVAAAPVERFDTR